jgi:diguanylate cyclase (GGDEF)-like protein
MHSLLQSGAQSPPCGEGAAAVPRRPWAGEAVVIIDVDQFAAIRARHGPIAGEQVTRAVADCLRRRLRRDDRIALLRDDEFLAVLPGALDVTLPDIAARIRDGIGALRLSLAGEIWDLSCTIGAAARTAQLRSLDGLVRAADSALHHARRGAGQVRGGG